MKIDKTFHCDGQDHAIRINNFEDDPGIYFSVYVSAFYGSQESILERLWHRAVSAFRILRGKEYLFNEIILSEKDAMALADSIYDATMHT